MYNSTHSLDYQLTVEGAENTGISLKLAGMGNRMLAFLIDFAIQTIISLFFLLGWMVFVMGSAPPEWFLYSTLAVIIFIIFFIQWGYYILFELLWQGQTPGKKVLRIRVVRENGRPLGILTSFIRNIFRIIDLLPSFYAAGLLTMFINYREKRIGDLVAGTIVVKTPEAALPSYSPKPSLRSRYTLQEHGDSWQISPRLHHLEVKEVELVRDFLERRYGLTPEKRKELGSRLSQSLAKKLKIDTPENPEFFLEHLEYLLSSTQNDR